MNQFKIVVAMVIPALLFSSCLVLAGSSEVAVTIQLVDSRQETISVSYDGKSRTLKLAPNAMIEVDGRRIDFASLLPGDSAIVTYDREQSLVTRIKVARDKMIPAEPLTDGWDEIDPRLIFLMVRLANVETSLEVIDQAIENGLRKSNSKSTAVERTDRANENLDRMGGGPLKWSQFYGVTAEKFFYHPTDQNSSYHTVTVLNQQGASADNKVGGGVPSSQGVPVHQRPPQFDYIYRANEKAKIRAEAEAYDIKGKLDLLISRRKKLATEQAGLWVDIAFRAISHYDLNKKPLYRFEPYTDGDTDFRNKANALRSAAVFMAIALSIIENSEKDQANTFRKLKPTINQARISLNDSWLRLSVDVSDRYSTAGRFQALCKRLEDIASNLSESYIVSTEGEEAKDQIRFDLFRRTLQASLIDYSQTALALDEMATELAGSWKIVQNIDKKLEFSNPLILTTTSRNQSFSSSTSSVQPSSSTGEKPSAAPSDTIRFGDKWYWFSNQSVPYGDALKYAAKMGGKLVSVKSIEENNFIRPKVRGPTILGIKRISGKYYDSKGAQHYFFNWCASDDQPNRNDGEDLVAIHRNGEWYDYHDDDSNRFFYIVEWDAK